MWEIDTYNWTICLLFGTVIPTGIDLLISSCSLLVVWEIRADDEVDIEDLPIDLGKWTKLDI